MSSYPPNHTSLKTYVQLIRRFFLLLQENIAHMPAEWSQTWTLMIFYLQHCLQEHLLWCSSSWNFGYVCQLTCQVNSFKAIAFHLCLIIQACFKTSISVIIIFFTRTHLFFSTNSYFPTEMHLKLFFLQKEQSLLLIVFFTRIKSKNVGEILCFYSL